MEKYFVISLPRSGTSTISKMAEMTGLKLVHPPHSSYRVHIKNENIHFLSDTPIFNPNVITEIIENKSITPKFIFIDRSFDDIFNSWVKCNLYRNYLDMYNQFESGDEDKLNSGQRFDFKNYNDAFNSKKLTEENYNEVFQNHKNTVINLVKKSNSELLIYNFEEGWGPFCNFLNKEVPNKDIPWINKGTMFDKI